MIFLFQCMSLVMFGGVRETITATAGRRVKHLVIKRNVTFV